MNKFMLAIAILWVLFTGYGVLMLLPFMDRRLWEWEVKFKRSKVPLAYPNRPQRVVFLLLTSLMTAVSVTSALHRNLTETIGVSSESACLLMILLPALYFALGRLKKTQTNREEPKA